MMKLRLLADTNGTLLLFFALGELTMTFKPANGQTPTTWKVYDYEGGGVGMAMYNTDESIKGFAKSCFSFALDKGWDLYLRYIYH